MTLFAFRQCMLQQALHSSIDLARQALLCRARASSPPDTDVHLPLHGAACKQERRQKLHRQEPALPGAVLLSSIVLQRQVLHLHRFALHRPEGALGPDLAGNGAALYADLQSEIIIVVNPLTAQSTSLSR